MKLFIFALISFMLVATATVHAASCDWADFSVSANELLNNCLDENFSPSCSQACEDALVSYYEDIEECYDDIIDQFGGDENLQAAFDLMIDSASSYKELCEAACGEDGEDCDGVFEVLPCLEDLADEVSDYVEKCTTDGFCSDGCLDKWEDIQKALYKDCLDIDYKSYLGYLESVCTLDKPAEVCSAKAGKLLLELQDECFDNLDEEGCDEDCLELIDELKAEDCDLADKLVEQYEPLCKVCSSDVFQKAEALYYVCDAAFEDSGVTDGCPDDCSDAVDEFEQSVKDCFDEDSFVYNFAMDLTSLYDKFCDNLLSSESEERYCAMEKGLDNFEDLVKSCSGLAERCSSDCFTSLKKLVDDVEEDCGRTSFSDLLDVVGCGKRKQISLSFKDFTCSDIYSDYYQFLKRVAVALDTDWYDIFVSHVDCNDRKRNSDTELTCANCRDATTENFDDAGLTLDEEPKNTEPEGGSNDDGDDDSASMIFVSLSAIIVAIVTYLF